MTNFQFTQEHINRLAEAGVKWAFEDQDPSTGQARDCMFVHDRHLKFDGLTPRGLLVGTATDLWTKRHGTENGMQLILHSKGNARVSISHTMIPFNGFEEHPTQEENLIDMIEYLAAEKRKREELTLEQKVNRMWEKFDAK